jgi:hypothetical protein
VGALKSGAEPAMVNQLAAVLDLDFALPVGPDEAPLPVPAPAVPAPVTPTPSPAPSPTSSPATSSGG